jgi:hypothetical protein
MQTHKLFNAMQVFSGTMPYQQLPPQLGWSQRRTPPRFRLVRGVAVVVIVVVAARRVVKRALKGEYEEGIVGFRWSGCEDRASLDGELVFGAGRSVGFG